VRRLDGVSDFGKVRIRVPSSIKPGDVVHVRTLVIHPMERIERDRQGKIIPKVYNYINKVVVTYLGKPVVTFDTTQSVSENPFFSFAFRATDPGPLRVEFLDTTGGRYEGRVDIKFA
jgi:thiosulfate oxidation carrier complex protein SoxZ